MTQRGRKSAGAPGARTDSCQRERNGGGPQDTPESTQSGDVLARQQSIGRVHDAWPARPRCPSGTARDDARRRASRRRFLRGRHGGPDQPAAAQRSGLRALRAALPDPSVQPASYRPLCARPVRRSGHGWQRDEDTFAATQSRQNSLPSMSCITMHDSLSSSAGSSRTRTAPSATSRTHSASSAARRFTHEPGADPHVKMQPILDDLAFG
jgi:hypothetical protein